MPAIPRVPRMLTHVFLDNTPTFHRHVVWINTREICICQDFIAAYHIEENRVVTCADFGKIYFAHIKV